MPWRSRNGTTIALADAFGDGIAPVRAALEPAAGIDEQRMAARRLNHDRVGLPDVEHRDAQVVRRTHAAARARTLAASTIAATASVRAFDSLSGVEDAATAPAPRAGSIVRRDAPCRRRRHRRSLQTGSAADVSTTPSIHASSHELRFAHACASGAHHASASCAAPSAIVAADAGHDCEVRGDGVRRELQKDRRAERPRAELRRERERQRFTHALREARRALRSTVRAARRMQRSRRRTRTRARTKPCRRSAGRRATR